MHRVIAAETPLSTVPARRRSALVTGSTTGIGLAIAEAAAAAGYDIMLQGHEPEQQVEPLRQRLQDAHSVRIVYMRADLTRSEPVAALLRQAQAAFQAVDLLVNNSTDFLVESIESTSLERWSQLMSENLTSAFLVTRAALPAMKARRSGRIVNIASSLGLVGQVACSAYAASMHGLIGLTRCAALETADHGVTVNAICPGYVRTPNVEIEIKAMAESRGITEMAAAAEIIASVHPSARYVTPKEIGDLVVFLASAKASSMTGAALPVDGGWTAR